MTVAPPSMPWQPVRQADATLVAQLADGLARRIDEQGLRPRAGRLDFDEACKIL